MALIVKRGKVPKTPHTEFYAKEGVLALEEIHGVYGFSGGYSRKMHLRRYPTVQVKPPRAAGFELRPRPVELPLQPVHVRSGRIPAGPDFARARRCLFYGPATAVSVAKPDRST